jgi:hypothetical protein
MLIFINYLKVNQYSAIPSVITVWVQPFYKMLIKLTSGIMLIACLWNVYDVLHYA